MLLNILFIIVAIVAIPFVVALFIKKNYAVEREIIVGKPRQEVFDYLKLLKNQESYSKWVQMDPHSKKEYRGTDGTVGFVSAWDSENKKVGKGEQRITSVTEGERIDIELRFIKPFEGIGYAYFITRSLSEDTTNVKWGMNGKNKYPLNFMNLFMNNMLGRDLEESLISLKHVLEHELSAYNSGNLYVSSK